MNSQTFNLYQISSHNLIPVIKIITKLAAYMCQAAGAALCCTSEKKHFFKVVEGIQIEELSQNHFLCTQVITENKIVEIYDLKEHPQFCSHRLVTMVPYLRYYIGIPLRNSHNTIIGVLSIFDTQPKKLSPSQRLILELLAELLSKLSSSSFINASLMNLSTFLLDKLPLGICILNNDGRFLYTNPYFCKITGFDQTYLLQIHLQDLLTPPYAKQFQDFITTFKPTFPLELHAHLKRAELHPLEVKLYAGYLDMHSKMIFLVIHPTTSPDPYRTLALNSFLPLQLGQFDQPIFITDPKGTIISANPQFLEIVGLPPTQFKPGILLLGLNNDLLYLNPVLPEFTKIHIFNREEDSLFKVKAVIKAIRNEREIILNYLGIVDYMEEIRKGDKGGEFYYLLSTNLILTYRRKACNPWPVQSLSGNAVALTGYSTEALCGEQGLNYNDLIVEEDRKQLIETISLKIASYQSYQMVYRIRTVSNKIKWILETGWPVYEGSGALRAIEGCIIDISDQKQLLELSRRWHFLMENALDGIMVINKEGHIVEANKALAALLKYELKELTSLNIWDIDAKWSYLELKDKLASISGKGKRFETVLKRKDGTYVEVEINAIFSESYILCICRDLSEYKNLLNRIIHLANEYQKIFDATNDVIWVIDKDRKILKANKATERLFLTKPEQIIGQLACKVLHGQLCPTGECPFEKAKQTKQREVIEAKVGRRWFEIIVDPILDETGQIISVIHIVSDISRRKQLELQFLRLQQLQVIERLASSIVHDLNNILTPMRMSVDVLKESYGKSEMANYIATLENCIERGSKIVYQLLAFTKSTDQSPVLIDLGDVIQDIETILKERFPKNIKLEKLITDKLWHISGIPYQIQQAILNLAIYSSDAMPNGGVITIQAKNVEIDELFASMNPGAKPGNYVCLKISDTSGGLPIEELENIFEPFIESDSYDLNTGLGLTAVRNIVENHGGFINVKSEVGKGTEFSLFFPAAPTQIPYSPVPRALPTGKGELILILDDENLLLHSIEQILKKYGYNVIGFTTAYEALSYFTQHPNEVKAIIVDLLLPDIPGAVFISTIRQINQTIPILVTTGFVEPKQLEELAAFKGINLLIKPFSKDELLLKLHNLLNTDKRLT